MFTKRFVALMLVLTTALCLCSCSPKVEEPKNTDEPTASATLEPTAEPLFAPKGTVVEGCEVVTNISDVVENALGDGQKIIDTSYYKKDTLFVLSSSETSSVLAHYNVESGEITEKFELPFLYADAFNYSYSGIVSAKSNGGAVIVDPVNLDIIVLDESLTEETRYPGSAPVAVSDAPADLSMLYCENDDSLLYYYSSLGAVLHKQVLGGESSVLYDIGKELYMITDMSLTDDSKQLNMLASYSMFDTPADLDSKHDSFVIDTTTGEVVEHRWINVTAYSDGDNAATSHSYCYTSDFTVNDTKIDVQFLQEYNNMIVDFDSNRAVSLLSVYTENEDVLMLSEYDTQTGELISRTRMPTGIRMTLSNSVLGSRSFSYDSERGAYCITYSQFTDTSEVVTSLIWQPVTGEIAQTDANDGSYNYLGIFSGLTPCINADIEGGSAAIIERIESKYDINIYFGESLREFERNNSFGSMHVTTFHDDVDDTYICECLLSLEKVLSQYPDGMIDQISASPDGKLSFFLCTSMDDDEIDLEIIGRYLPWEGNQLVFATVIPNSANDLSDGGNPGNFFSLYHHEICHAIQRVVMDAGMYTYEDWTANWPENFVFDDPDNFQYIMGDPENTYFVDDYAMTSILEDMSRLFEYATWEELPEVLQCPHVNARLKYFCELIRDAFDTDGTWPDVVRWERAVVIE